MLRFAWEATKRNGLPQKRETKKDGNGSTEHSPHRARAYFANDLLCEEMAAKRRTRHMEDEE
jgi:hypothetical protein